MEENLTYFGIDLGTTYSVVSYIDEYGKPAVVRDLAEGKETTPSVVYFENAENVVVGQQAKNVAVLHPDRVVQRVKRDMGQERSWEFDGEQYTPEKISALILKQLAQNAAQETGRDVRDVVITVPAYFGMLERDATRNAGRISGLNVIGIVPEPVAAALQYDIADAGKERYVLVYDLGGGTFDTSIIRVSDTAVEVVCTDGDQELGGVDWDDRLVAHILEEFDRTTGKADDAREDPQFMQGLRERAEELKRALTNTQSRVVPLQFAGATASVELTREDFERVTRDLLENTLRYTDRTLATFATKTGVADAAGTIDEVLLVGGSSKMPMVAAALAEKYGWKPKLHDPDLAVAKGAARFALSRAVWAWDGDESEKPSEKERKERVSVIAQRAKVDEDALARIAAKQITTVLPKAFGIKLVDTKKVDPGTTGWETRDDSYYVEHLVHANDSLPIEKHFTAGTLVPNQREVSIEIYEQAGSHEGPELAANKPVDRAEGLITGLPPLPAHAPIDIQMSIDSEGLLHVEAAEPSSGRSLTINVRISLLSEEEVADARSAVSAIAVRS